MDMDFTTTNGAIIGEEVEVIGIDVGMSKQGAREGARHKIQKSWPYMCYL